MAPRERNYAAEYERRISRAQARGFTRTQARGHPEESHSPSVSLVNRIASSAQRTSATIVDPAGRMGAPQLIITTWSETGRPTDHRVDIRAKAALYAQLTAMDIEEPEGS